MNIYVGNLSYQMNESDLKTMFEAYGTVDSARIVTDRDTGRSKGFGFVEMPDQEQAQAAIKGLHETEMSGRNITVNEARPKPERRETSGSGGFNRNRNRY
ncbi:RNA-binding protein [Candidatus Sumerlaeota bacterium]|nr:RNA-binding protein [Candidatus Sumerlaeota bacterium]